MRYYSVILTPPPATSNASATSGSASPANESPEVYSPPSSAASTKNATSSKPVKFTSYPNGATDLGALNVIMDIYTLPTGVPFGASNIQIWGISLNTISNAFDFNGWNIEIEAGFQKGLPLANPNQKGTILKGKILQAFGNWQSTDMNLNLVAIAGYMEPFNGAFIWPAGQNIEDALSNFFSISMPGYTFVKPTLHPNLIFAYDQSYSFPSLEAFSKWLKQYTQISIGGNYPGVDIRIDGTNIVAYDNTLPANEVNSAQDTKNTPTIRVVEISFVDLVGQPTWIDPRTILFKCPMRADLKLGDVAHMPVGYFGIAPNQSSLPWNYRDKSAQSGYFQIFEVHHLGNFRQPDGNSWVTVYRGVQVAVPGKTQ